MLKILLFLSVIIFTAAKGNFAQTAENPSKPVNFGYSQNPKIKTRPNAGENNNKQSNSKVSAQVTSEIAAVNNPTQAVERDAANNGKIENVTIAKKTLEIVKRANAKNVSPTEIYKIGVGDVLFISLQNAPSSSSNYFTVLNDGTIDYPLAGQMVSVLGLTNEETEDLLKEKIKLFENPQVSVKVREHASHSIIVLGLVDKAGVKFLPREAMPLYFVRAEAIVQSKANQAVVKRPDSDSEILDLNDATSDNFLVFPGDIVEFKFRDDGAIGVRQPQFFYIGGNIVSAGQKDFFTGITLTQAILASGGLRKQSVKKIIVRRKNAQGMLATTEVNFKAIYDGKEPDLILEAGDTIEILN